MSKVVIVTDSESCLPSRLIREHDLKIIPISLVIDGKTFTDDIDITAAEFWARYDTISQCKTGMPSPGVFDRVFKEAAKQSEDIVCILLSRSMSGIHDSAIIARDMVRAENPNLNIEIVDSKKAIGAVGFVALTAARTAADGGSLVSVVQAAREMADRVKWMNGLKNANVVSRFGRVPKTVSGDKSLDIMRIIGQLDEKGTTADLGRAEGKLQCFQRMIDLIQENTEAGRPLHINVHYTNNINDGEELLRLVKKSFKCDETYLTAYPPSIGVTAGPSTGLSFFS